MIEIEWKHTSKESPKFKYTAGENYDSIELVWCLVSDGDSVWEEHYDPSEGWSDDCIIKFIEIKNINP